MKKRLILSVFMAAAMAVPANAATFSVAETNTTHSTHEWQQWWDEWCKKIFGNDIDPADVEDAFGPDDTPAVDAPPVIEEWEDEDHTWHTGTKGDSGAKGGTKVPQQIAPGGTKGGVAPQQVNPDAGTKENKGIKDLNPGLPQDAAPTPTPQAPKAKGEPQVQLPDAKGDSKGDAKAPDTKTPDAKGDSKGHDTGDKGTDSGTKGGDSDKDKNKNPGTNPGGNGDGSGSGNGSGNGNGSGTNPNTHRRQVIRISGETRYETAVEVSKREYPNGGAKAVIIARGDVAADSVSAVPLAEAMDAPVLLTPSDNLHKATAAEMKRLLPNGGKVVIMGGEDAVNKNVASEITKMGGQVERIAGQNRAGTAVETANRLHMGGELKELLIADGANWQDDLIAGPAAAEVDGATLLTNGDKMAPETESFLKQHGNLKLTAIGENAVKASKATNKVVGDTPTTLSLNVAKHFFKNPKAVGVATTADFADALAGGALVAENNGPILLSPQMIPVSLVDYLNANQTVTTVYVFGGTERFSNDQIALLGK